MAQYRVSVSVIHASDGRSPIAASAYINGASSKEIETLNAASAYLSGAEVGSYDYSGKKGVLFSEFIGPEQYWCSEGRSQRVAFWTNVVNFERQHNRRYYDKETGEPKASLARDHKVNLPYELPLDVNIQLARAYALEYRRRYGIAGEIAVHQAPGKGGDNRNIHFHFLHNERAVDEGGNFSKTKAEFTRGNRVQHLREMREWWAARVQRELKKHGVKSEFDHRSNDDRGIKRAPTIHVGPHLMKLERMGIPTAPGEFNRALNEFHKRYRRKPTQDEIETIQRRASVARKFGNRKSRALKYAGRDEARKRKAIVRERAFAAILRRIGGTIQETERANEELARLIVAAIRCGSRAIIRSQRSGPDVINAILGNGNTRRTEGFSR